jgi:uncharacterized protein (DUF779 family)
MTAQEIIERIMTQHWDLIACSCWVCDGGRRLGYHPRDGYLPYKSAVKLGRVSVEGVK